MPIFDWFYAPMRVLMAAPQLGLLIAAAYFVLWRGMDGVHRARPVVLGAAVVWIIFSVYEWRMSIWSKTVVAPIRVDLLVITPILYAASVLGAVVWWRARRRSR